ncbi:MAG: zinc ribbon domain-containing protein [Lachnospiraceae bacterium]|nr:zinc ribbon domain-containing protein [Lachnospiraceae bacterium]
MAFFGPHNAEINQINSQIKMENGKLSGYQYTLGVMLLKRLDEGATFDDEIMEQYAQVQASRTAIETYNQQLATIQQQIAEEEAARQAEKERKAAEAAVLREARRAELAAKANSLLGRGSAPASGATCPGCGNVVAPGMLFCNKCGTKLPEAPAPAAGKTCPNCGNAVNDGMAFCNKCGTKLG